MSIQKALEKHLHVSDDLEEILGISEAVKEIEGMKCDNCKHLNIRYACLLHEIGLIPNLTKRVKCDSWEATK